MNYNFKEYKVGSGHKFCGLTIRDKQLSLSKSFAKMIKKEYFEVMYDEKNKAVFIRPCNKKEYSYRLRLKSNGTIATGCSISNIMPRGRYYDVGNHGILEFNDGFILKLKEDKSLQERREE